MTLLIISTGTVFTPVFTEKSMSPALSVVILFPSTLQRMPLPMSKVIVMSFPLMLSNISPGTTVEPFISTLITLPSSAFSSSARMTSQPILPSAPLMNGCFVPCAGVPALPLPGVVPGLTVFPVPGFTGVVPVPGVASCLVPFYRLCFIGFLRVASAVHTNYSQS